MKQIYRLMRLRGEPRWKSAGVAFLAVVGGEGSWARYTLMEQRLNALDEES